MAEPLLSLREVADRLGLSPAQLRQLARQGKLPASKHAGRWLVELADLDKVAPPGVSPATRGRARVAEATALSDFEHRLHGGGAVVSEPRQSDLRPAAAIQESAAVDRQLGLGDASVPPVARKERVRDAQRKNLEALRDRIEKPATPERSI